VLQSCSDFRCDLVQSEAPARKYFSSLILDRFLPDKDDLQPSRLAAANKYKDPQINAWIDEIDQLEKEIFKSGRTESVAQRIVELKRKIDVNLLRYEFADLMSTLAPSPQPPATSGTEDMWSDLQKMTAIVQDRIELVNLATPPITRVTAFGSGSAADRKKFREMGGQMATGEIQRIQVKLADQRQLKLNKMADLDKQIAEQDRKINEALAAYYGPAGPRNLISSTVGTDGAGSERDDRRIAELYNQKEKLLQQRSSTIDQIEKLAVHQSNFARLSGDFINRLDALIAQTNSN